jgi:hypothetical protein
MIQATLELSNSSSTVRDDDDDDHEESSREIECCFVIEQCVRVVLDFFII